VVAFMEELVAGVGCGRKKEKPSVGSKKEKLVEKREKLAVAPPSMRWPVGGYASELWWRWW